MEPILVILVILAPLAILFGLGWIFENIWNNVVDCHPRSADIPAGQMEMILLKKFPYYSKLPRHHQLRFIDRLSAYMSAKEFTGRKNLIVTDEMRVLISASAIQVTFGLDDYIMDNFPRIYIYPDAYKSKITGKYHKGEVNLAGIIALSWPDFVKGYDVPDNNRNLGLHEMAHAVRFAKFKGDYDQFFSDYFDKWARIAKNEFENVRDKEGPSIFRDYAGSNINEFFSVCTEHFFETPQRFRDELPELYYHTCILLNQDPSREPIAIDVREHFLQKAGNPRLKKVLLSTGYNVLPAFIFVVLCIPTTMGYTKSSDLLTGTLLYWPLVIAGAATANRFMKQLIIYDDGIEVRHPLTTAITPRRIIPFSHVLSAELREHASVNNSYEYVYSYTIEVKYIYEGGTYSYEATENIQVLRATGEYLHNNRVAVKVFNEKLKWN